MKRVPRGGRTYGPRQEAEVAFIDQVGEWESVPLVLQRHLHHKAQIVLDEFIARLLIPLRNAAAEGCLDFRREQ